MEELLRPGHTRALVAVREAALIRVPLAAIVNVELKVLLSVDEINALEGVVGLRAQRVDKDEVLEVRLLRRPVLCNEANCVCSFWKVNFALEPDLG